MSDRQRSAENIIPMILDLHPLVLEVGKNLARALKGGDGLANLSSHLRKEAALSLGIVVPTVKLRENSTLSPEDFVVKIREVMVHKGGVRSSRSPEAVLSFLKDSLSRIVQRYAYEFLGPEEVQGLLDHLRSLQPGAVEEVYPSLLSLPEIQRILQNLLKEGVPIRDLARILEVLADSAVHTRDPELLTEYVRHSMPRVLGGLYHDSFIIRAYVLEEKIEQWIIGAVRWEGQVVLDFHPDVARKILKSLHKKFQLSKVDKKGGPLLLVSPEIRRFVKMLTERPFPQVPVLSYNEISSEYKVKVLGTVRLEPWKDRLCRLRAFATGRPARETFPGDNIQKAILILNLIGSAANSVAQYLSPWEREILTNRSAVAPVPVLGKDQVVREFLSQLPKEKKVSGPDALCDFAGREPATVAAVLQKNWLSQLAGQDPDSHPYNFMTSEPGGRDDTDPKEKAAIFITSAARWIQDEVYRSMTVDELKELGCSMLRFPSISPDGKRKAWEEYEGLLYKDEWWDPDTLIRFLRASMKGEIEEFKKRGFRQTQKLAVLLLSLPAAMGERIGKAVLAGLTRSELLQTLGEMGQWRDHLPPETRLATLQEFLDYGSGLRDPDQPYSEAFLRMEVERIALRDPRGAVSVIRNLWLSLRDPRSIFETLSMRTPARIVNLLLSYLHNAEAEQPPTPKQKTAALLGMLDPGLRDGLESEMSEDEKDLPDLPLPSRGRHGRILHEFIRGYYGGDYPNPLPFLKRN